MKTMTKGSVNRYKASRQDAGLTQEQAAEALSIAVRTLSDYENCHVRPPDDTVLAMMDAYSDISLGYEHIYDSELGRKVLAKHSMPESNGCVAVQAWNAQDTLGHIVKKLQRLFRGKSHPSDLCESDKAKMAKKIDLLEQVRGEIVSTTLYLKQAIHGANYDKRKRPPFHKRPKMAR